MSFITFHLLRGKYYHPTLSNSLTIMAPSAVNGDEPATIGAEEISKPPPGIVLPPKDIRGTLPMLA